MILLPLHAQLALIPISFLSPISLSKTATKSYGSRHFHNFIFVSGAALRLFIDCDVIFHLRHHWNAIVR